MWDSKNSRSNASHDCYMPCLAIGTVCSRSRPVKMVTLLLTYTYKIQFQVFALGEAALRNCPLQ
jgi:hypothetical protein